MKRSILMIILSAWIVYHLGMIVLMPNGGSFPGRQLQKFYNPYANSLMQNATWNFFSPDPAHTMYIHYWVHTLNPEGIEDSDPIENFYPVEKNEGAFSLTHRRHFYAMRFMMLNRERLNLFLGPWLCKKYPGASEVRMEHIIETIPPFDQFLALKSDSVKDLAGRMESGFTTHTCEAVGNESVNKSEAGEQ